MPTTSAAISELADYCDMAVRHSYDQYERDGTLLAKAAKTFQDADIWNHKWVPDDFDVCDGASHPVWQAFTPEQKLAWNHLLWALDYSSVAQGERQIVVLNNFAVKEYAHILPSVCELERRESFEETDHIEAFVVGLEGVRARYFKNRKAPLLSDAASGFQNPLLNKISRHAMGLVANRLMGPNFPTLFFLARGMKTHGFKPFENAIFTNDEAPEGIRQIARLHRLDESRHMATSLNLARLSNEVLDTLPKDNRIIMKAAIQAAFPHGRSADYRLTYWKRVFDQSTIYADIPRRDRDALYAHMEQRIEANLTTLHERQARLTRQANKRIIEECGLSPAMKRLFVEVMRKDPAYAATVDAVVIDN